ncbi:MAG: hypothetical protein A2X94_10825 [Bdellovibrionales bacterium GWB1_55_8]|nr:MAG: hypothetical protein A2X94_10825 [Bdellovibrionales bacterium GWB1_55_8]
MEMKHRPSHPEEPVFMNLVARIKGCCQDREHSIRERADLTEAEYRALFQVPMNGDVSSGELARKMGISPSRASRVIDGLVNRELLVRTNDSDDRRVSLLSLSGKGRTVKNQIESFVMECEQEIRKQLARDEYDRATEGLRIAIQALEGD